MAVLEASGLNIFFKLQQKKEICASTNRDSDLNEPLFALEEDVMVSKYFTNSRFLARTWPSVQSTVMKKRCRVSLSDEMDNQLKETGAIATKFKFWPVL